MTQHSILGHLQTTPRVPSHGSPVAFFSNDQRTVMHSTTDRRLTELLIECGVFTVALLSVSLLTQCCFS
uniref:Movement protein n=1 Tax=Ascaris lumbricoides TaxID=6252 RepID=A0A0M3HQH6_ASCLU